jgi:twitching motility two-component system response regulator PilG
MLVDDSRVVHKIVEKILQRERIEVVSASDGLQALAILVEAQPDLMLLDILLPRMDGYQVCQVVRRHPDFRDLPILLLSARGSVVDRMRGKLVGSTDYISKPFDPAELLLTVQRHLNSSVVRKRAARRKQDLSLAPKR